MKIFLLSYLLFPFLLTSIRDCASDLIHDMSDVAFTELMKYRIFQNSKNSQTTNVEEQPLIGQHDDYSNLVNQN